MKIVNDNEKIKKIYADTSVYGGVKDTEFSIPSSEFFVQVKHGLVDLHTSAVVREEILSAPESIRRTFDEMLEYADVLEVTAEALQLQRDILKQK